MAICQKCGAQVADGTTFCATCGAPVAQQAAPQYQQPAAPQYQQPAPQYQQPAPQYAPAPMVVDPSDHTAEFDAKDISDNKVTAMAAYLLGVLGIVIALLAAPESKYASFHARQALKLEVVNVLVTIAMAVLSIIIIGAIVGPIALAALFVIRIILFIHVCQGKAKDAPLIGKLKFLG